MSCHNICPCHRLGDLEAHFCLRGEGLTHLDLYSKGLPDRLYGATKNRSCGATVMAPLGIHSGQVAKIWIVCGIH